jgi:hypothetical protein
MSDEKQVPNSGKPNKFHEQNQHAKDRKDGNAPPATDAAPKPQPAAQKQ